MTGLSIVQKNVLITGSAKRVGAACARLLHANGWNVLLHYRGSENEAVALGKELNSLRANSAQVYKADLQDLSQLEKLAERSISAWGGVDGLVNNASEFYPTNFADISLPQWDELMGSNLKAPFFLAKALSTSLSKRRGCIINMVDIHAERGYQGYPVYSISKAGLAAMTRILAKELAPEIRVNAVAPGAILWPEQDLSEDEKQQIISRIPLQRKGCEDDIAKTVDFLIRNAPYITGQIINVDGGRSLYS